MSEPTTDQPVPEWNPDHESAESVDATQDDACAAATDNTPDTESGEAVVADDGAEDDHDDTSNDTANSGTP